MRCRDCGEDADLVAVIDGLVCHDCYSHWYILCPECLEVHHVKHMLMSVGPEPICSGCYDNKTYKE